MKSPLVNPEVPNPIHGFHEVPWGSSWILWISASWSFIRGFYEVTQFFFQKYYGPSPSWIPWTCWSLIHGFYEVTNFFFQKYYGPSPSWIPWTCWSLIHGFSEVPHIHGFAEVLQAIILRVFMKFHWAPFMDFMKTHQIHIKQGVFMKYVQLNKTHEFH